MSCHKINIHLPKYGIYLLGNLRGFPKMCLGILLRGGSVWELWMIYTRKGIILLMCEICI